LTFPALALVDAHALSAPVKASKSRQIAANGIMPSRTWDQTTSKGIWHFPGLMKYDFCVAEEAASGRARKAESFRKPTPELDRWCRVHRTARTRTAALN
jgi:hypothetical protein